VKVPTVPGVSERDAGEAPTPLGKVPTVTDTEPAKPFWAVTETCTAWPVLPCASVTAAGDSETVKVGVGG